MQAVGIIAEHSFGSCRTQAAESRAVKDTAEKEGVHVLVCGVGGVVEVAIMAIGWQGESRVTKWQSTYWRCKKREESLSMDRGCTTQSRGYTAAKETAETNWFGLGGLVWWR